MHMIMEYEYIMQLEPRPWHSALDPDYAYNAAITFLVNMCYFPLNVGSYAFMIIP